MSPSACYREGEIILNSFGSTKNSKQLKQSLKDITDLNALNQSAWRGVWARRTDLNHPAWLSSEWAR